MIAPPEPSEYASFYAGYIGQVGGQDILATLKEEEKAAHAFYSSLTEKQGDLRYAPNKWTIKEVIGHVIDTERIMAYRALRIARNDKTNLPGFEQDDYIITAESGKRTIADLVSELGCVRAASIALFRSFGDEAWPRRGTANNFEITVRAVAYMLAGHEIHHRRIVKARYLNQSE